LFSILNVMSSLECGTLHANTTLHVASVTSTGHIFSSTGTATCEAGYRLTSSSNNSYISQTVRCEESGTWTPLTGCEPKGDVLFGINFVFNTALLFCFQTLQSFLLQSLVAFSFNVFLSVIFNFMQYRHSYMLNLFKCLKLTVFLF